MKPQVNSINSIAMNPSNTHSSQVNKKKQSDFSKSKSPLIRTREHEKKRSMFDKGILRGSEGIFVLSGNIHSPEKDVLKMRNAHGESRSRFEKMLEKVIEKSSVMVVGQKKNQVLE